MSLESITKLICSLADSDAELRVGILNLQLSHEIMQLARLLKV